MTAFYALVMTLGYTYGVCTGGVSDNILNNFSTDDTLMNVGRVGLAVTLLASFPLLTVPLIGTLVRAQRELIGEPCISLRLVSFAAAVFKRRAKG